MTSRDHLEMLCSSLRLRRGGKLPKWDINRNHKELQPKMRSAWCVFRDKTSLTAFGIPQKGAMGRDGANIRVFEWMNQNDIKKLPASGFCKGSWGHQGCISTSKHPDQISCTSKFGLEHTPQVVETHQAEQQIYFLAFDIPQLLQRYMGYISAVAWLTAIGKLGPSANSSVKCRTPKFDTPKARTWPKAAISLKETKNFEWKFHKQNDHHNWMNTIIRTKQIKQNIHKLKKKLEGWTFDVVWCFFRFDPPSLLSVHVPDHARLELDNFAKR